MDTNTYLVDMEKIYIDNFYIMFELFRIWKDEDDVKIYEIDIHIWWELWCIWKTKAIWTTEEIAKQKFDKFVSMAKEIKNMFE